MYSLEVRTKVLVTKLKIKHVHRAHTLYKDVYYYAQRMKGLIATFENEWAGSPSIKV